MIKIRALLLGAALAAGSAVSAMAADLYGGSIKDGYMPVPTVAPSSWYIRGDVSHSRYDRPTMIESGRFDLTGAEIDNQWAAGLGVGYYFSKSVRADLTWDYRFETDARGTVPFGPGPGPLVNFPGERSFGLKSNVFLANLYYDFDLRSRFTPYVGIGLGFANNKTTTGSVPDNCACGFTNVVIEGASKWSVAGALMSGFSYNVRDRLHLDAGYRYLYLGEAHTGLITGNGGGLGGTDGDPAVKDIWAHEFRVGLRYDIR